VNTRFINSFTRWRHNATKVLLLTSQTKLTLAVTLNLNRNTNPKLTLTLLNPNIYAHFVDTH